MSADKVAPNSDALQFDRALSTSGAAAGSGGAAVVCANCGAAITTEYYHIGGHTVCAKCRDLVLTSVATPRGWGAPLKAGVFGIGAAIAGAIIYYGVIAITNFEIGIVAILIGYMVGYMVRKGAGGKGGRRFQIIALILTYWSVGLAYSPLAFKEFAAKEGKKAVAATDSARASRPDSGAAASAVDTSLTGTAPGRSTKAKSMTSGAFLIGIGAILLLTFALPFIVVLGSLPSGLLSGIIIGIGLRQAWRMTGAPRLNVSGPYKVGASPSASPA